MQQAIKKMFGYPLADEYARNMLANMSIINKFEGLKWGIFGDSLSQPNTDGLDKYYNIICNKRNMTYTSYAIGGSGWFKSNTSNNYGSGNISSQIKSASNEFDIISIMAGVNERGFIGSKLGTIDDPVVDVPTTLCGAVKKAISEAQAKYPNSIIFVMTTIPGETFNALNDKDLNSYCNKIKEICELYNVPYLDLFHSSNLKPWLTENKAKYYRDYIHLNSEGQKYISKIIENFLNNLI